MNQADFLGSMLSITIGLVVDIDDPQGLNRVKVNYPLLGDTIVSDWAPVATFLAGPGYGGFFQPRIGNEVLVGFIHGNPNMPYVLGSVWNGTERPPVQTEQQKTVSKIQTPGGHVITFDESDESPSLTISDQAENKIVIDQKSKMITVSAIDGVKIQALGSSVSISAPQVSIAAEEEISMKSAQVNITAYEMVSINGSEVQIKADEMVSIKGTEARIEADIITSIDSSEVSITADTELNLRSASINLD